VTSVRHVVVIRHVKDKADGLEVFPIQEGLKGPGTGGYDIDQRGMIDESDRDQMELESLASAPLGFSW